MSLLDDFIRVSQNRRCPICDHADWCLVRRGDPPASVICSRVESPTRWGEAGWIHRLTNEAPRVRPIRHIITILKPSEEMARIARAYQEAVVPGVMERFARSLGVSAMNLQRLGIGWTGRCWAFPMQGRDGAICGIRIRASSGKKFSERGGKEGLFVPRVLSGTGALVITEGPTDCCALLDLGFDAVGRPSCTGGTRLLVDFVRRGCWKSHVICADAGKPGTDGALALARALAPISRDLRVIVPPAKDAREWKQAGATRVNVLALIEAAPPIRISVRRVMR
jgi:hypothetical protein